MGCPDGGRGMSSPGRSSASLRALPRADMTSTDPRHSESNAMRALFAAHTPPDGLPAPLTRHGWPVPRAAPRTACTAHRSGATVAVAMTEIRVQVLGYPDSDDEER